MSKYSVIPLTLRVVYVVSDIDTVDMMSIALA